MRQFFTNSIILLCILNARIGASQSELSNVPAVWLKADKGVGISGSWTDQSGHASHAVSEDGVWPLLDTTINFNPAFLFTGEDFALKTPVAFDTLAANVIMSVYHPFDTLDRGVWATQQTFKKASLLTVKRALGPDSVVDHFSGPYNQPTLNTLTQNWIEEPVITIDPNASMTIGGAGKERNIKAFKGAFAEFIVFDRALTFLEKVQFQTYLAIKYGIPLIESNYVSSGEQVLWSHQAHGDYGSRIIGIGRDDALGLYQKQSRSASDTSNLMLFSVGAPALTNAANKSSISEGNFILMGDNGGGLKTRPSENKYNPLSMLERKWLVKATGATVKDISTELHVDFSKIPADSLGYWMVVDRSGAGDFSVNNLEYLKPDSITRNKIAIFKNLKWDKDGSGADMFSFARIEDFLVAVQTLTDPTCADRTAGTVLVNMISGKGPYHFNLAHSSSDIVREWRGNGAAEQKNLTQGRYMLTVTAVNGRVQERPFTLHLADGPVIDLGEEQDLKGKASIELDASINVSGVVSPAYEWTSNFGFFGSGPKAIIVESGIYTATVTDLETGCYASDNVPVTGSSRTKFSTYPTLVTDGLINVSVSLTTPENVSIVIYDTNGTLLRELKGKNQSEYLFKTHIEKPGMYLVVLKAPAELKSKKIIVQ